jgi:hypothetical protein
MRFSFWASYLTVKDPSRRAKPGGFVFVAPEERILLLRVSCYNRNG